MAKVSFPEKVGKNCEAVVQLFSVLRKVLATKTLTLFNKCRGSKCVRELPFFFFF